MVHRIVELGIVALWLVSMALLVARDAIPRWFAQPAPQSASVGWLESQGTEYQYGIYGEDGLRRGRCWTVYDYNRNTIVRRDTLVLGNLRFIGDLLVRSKLTFLDETQLDDIEIEITALEAAIVLHGERHGPQFAFELTFGTAPPQEFVLDADAAQQLCDVIKPFSALRGLQVGQSWKMHTIDPLSLLENRHRSRPRAVVATVVGEEEILVEGQRRTVFVVQSEGSRAWVDANGRVVLQVVDVPGLGKIEIREQTFQPQLYKNALTHWGKTGGHESSRDRTR